MPLDLEAVRAGLSATMGRDELYATLARVGLEYGPAFRGVEQVWSGWLACLVLAGGEVS